MKWMGAAVLIPIVLFSSLAALLYFPPFQRWAVKQASAYASEKTGMDVSVGNVRLRFPLDLSLNEVVAVKRETGDTIANVGAVVADVQLRPLLKKQVVIDELMLEKADTYGENGYLIRHVPTSNVTQLRKQLLFGIKNKNSWFNVRFYIIYTNGVNTHIYYSDACRYDYRENV